MTSMRHIPPTRSGSSTSCIIPNLLVTLLLTTLHCSLVLAGFTTNFEAVASGTTLQLTWDALTTNNTRGKTISSLYPLYITAQLLDRSADGQTTNGFRVNLTTTVVNGSTSFAWHDVPYPLHWSSTGLYEVEIKSGGDGGGGTALVRSPYFAITGGMGVGGSQSGSGMAPALVTVPSSSTGLNEKLAIGLGVAIGVPSAIGLALVSWCFRRRQRKAAEELRRKRRLEFIIE